MADSSLRGGYALCFLDDGEGMDPSECLPVYKIDMYHLSCGTELIQS